MTPAFRLSMGCLLLWCTGCGSPLSSGQGQVRFSDGQPVQSGSIEFRARGDATRYASRIDSEGRFELQNIKGKPGIEAGIYDVVVVQVVLTEDLTLDQHTHGRTVPRRYADYYTSELHASIAADSTEPIEIVLD